MPAELHSLQQPLQVWKHSSKLHLPCFCCWAADRRTLVTRRHVETNFGQTRRELAVSPGRYSPTQRLGSPGRCKPRRPSSFEPVMRGESRTRHHRPIRRHLRPVSVSYVPRGRLLLLPRPLQTQSPTSWSPLADAAAAVLTTVCDVHNHGRTNCHGKYLPATAESCC